MASCSFQQPPTVRGSELFASSGEVTFATLRQPLSSRTDFLREIWMFCSATISTGAL